MDFTLNIIVNIWDLYVTKCGLIMRIMKDVSSDEHKSWEIFCLIIKIVEIFFFVVCLYYAFRLLNWFIGKRLNRNRNGTLQEYTPIVMVVTEQCTVLKAKFPGPNMYQEAFNRGVAESGLRKRLDSANTNLETYDSNSETQHTSVTNRD